ncbi:hypothetical protein NFI96_006109 [Prochilodus magdalenae]|nr:hypothetical protein NFI96_006109 [Prochilodus magdalenae]
MASQAVPARSELARLCPEYMNTCGTAAETRQCFGPLLLDSGMGLLRTGGVHGKGGEGSLERRLQRPLLAKSRTLPSIPQSPTVGRVHQHLQMIGGSPPRPRLPSSPGHLSAPTLPPAGDAWRLEDDKEVEPQEAGLSGVELRPRSQSPFSHFRSRSAYLRKSVSVDGQLGVAEFDSTHSEGRGSRNGKGKLKRKFCVCEGVRVREGGEDGRWEMCLPQPSQEVETLLGFLGYGAGVEGPGEILCQVNSKELGALDDLHSGAVDV